MYLIIGDLHLTDHARDSYRYGIFDWIRRQQSKNDVAATFLLGDLTDQKDRHSATLVNRIVTGLVSLKPPVYIPRGNHDYKADQDNPFFKFLNHIEGIKFVTDPTVVKVVKPVALIPHYRTQEEFDDAVRNCAGAKPACFFVHQTFDGAIAESGIRLSGLSASPIELLQPELGVYAGDVHRPQTQGIVTYVGCPYQVRFGDDFEPRCIYLAKSGTESYPWFEAPRKWSLTVRGPENLLTNKELYRGDQVKLTIELAREEAVQWQQVRQAVLAACKKLQLDVYGVKLEVKTVQRRQRIKLEGTNTVTDTFELFCKTENIAAVIREAGRELLNDDANTL